MYPQVVRFYLFVLTLLEISLNSKLTALGKSHGKTFGAIYDPLVSEGITFQEWGSSSSAASSATGPLGALQLTPARLSFGTRALGAAHALTVTVTNHANCTLHLASVAGTTPDFHASFFEAKTLPPAGNTTFSVVFVARREGPARAHLYIHTSLGVHKYQVSAAGAGSPWALWPLLDIVVPQNASVQPLLTLKNPTARPVQVTAVYSSARWLKLSLPSDEARAPRASWLLPPGEARQLLRLRPNPPADNRVHSAYVRIVTEPSSGAPLLLTVAARAAPRGLHAVPHHLRPGTRGTGDPPDTFSISLGNSAQNEMEIELSSDEPRCEPLQGVELTNDGDRPSVESARHGRSNGELKGRSNGELSRGGRNIETSLADGAVLVTLLTERLAPHAPLRPAATVTIDYGALWAGAIGAIGATGADGAVGANGAGARCWGAVKFGAAVVPYSATLLPGTLRIDPLHFVWSTGEAALHERWVRVRNEFQQPLRVIALEPDDNFHRYFVITQPFTVRTLAGGASGTLLAVRVRSEQRGVAAQAQLVLRTDGAEYRAPLLLYSGKLHLEWERGWGSTEVLELGALTLRSALAVRVRVHADAPPAAVVCLRSLDVRVRGATLALDHCRPRANDDVPECCIAGGTSVYGWLRVRPMRPGHALGTLWVRASAPHAPHARAITSIDVSYRAVPGHMWAPAVLLQDCAPLVPCGAPLRLLSSVPARMRVLAVRSDDPALTYRLEDDSHWLEQGGGALGELVYSAVAEGATGLLEGTTDRAAWDARAHTAARALPDDVRLLRARLRAFKALPPDFDLKVEVRTSEVTRVPVNLHARMRWPRLSVVEPDSASADELDSAPASTDELDLASASLADLDSMGDLEEPWLTDAEPWLAAVSTVVTRRLRVRNPSDRPLILHALVADYVALPNEAGGGAADCGTGCVASASVFTVTQWQVLRGQADPAPANLYNAGGEAAGMRPLLLAPLTELELTVTFKPPAARLYSAHLYLRNNLTVLETVRLRARGSTPAFEVDGRAPHSLHRHALRFEVTGCGVAAVRRTVVVRNTGAVPLDVQVAGVSGSGCLARGFSVRPCGATERLPPNGTRALELAFSTDWTLARVTASVALHTGAGRAKLYLRAAVPPALLQKCVRTAPRPGWEPPVRAAAAAVALALAALLVALAALDAEAILKRALAAMQRARNAPSHALDLRTPAPRVTAPPAQAHAQPAHSRRRRQNKKHQPQHLFDDKKDAFEEWKASLLGNSSVAPEPPAKTEVGAVVIPQAQVEPEVVSTRAIEDESSRSSAEEAEREEPPIVNEKPAVRVIETRATGEEEEDDASSGSSGSPAGVRVCRPPAPRVIEPPRRVAPPPAKFHAKKEKLKRKERAPAPARVLPLPLPPPPPPPVLRRGATFSEVVARADSLYCGAPAVSAPPPPRPLPPIGSDVPRRELVPPAAPPALIAPAAVAPARHHDNSLFYFNGECERTERWELAGRGVWAGGVSAWEWGCVRPPPGFPVPPPAPPVRAYDPFHALAAIWAPDRPAWSEPLAPEPKRRDY